MTRPLMPGPGSANQKPKKSSWIFSDQTIPVYFFVAALLVRIIYLLKARPAWGNDDERYIFIARSLLAFDFQNAIHFHYPPFSAFLVAIVSLVFRNLETAARITAITANALTIIPIYFLALRIFGRRTAILASAFFALRFFQFAASDLVEQVEILFLFLAILSGFFTLKNHRPSSFFLTGALFGVSFLTKPEAWAFFLLFLLISLIRGIWVRRNKKSAQPETPPISSITPGKILGAILLLPLGYFLVTGFYLVSYDRAAGQFSFNPKARTLFILHNLYQPQGLQYYLQEDERGYYTLAQRIMEGDRIPVQPSISEILWRNRGSFPAIYSQRFWFALYRYLGIFYLQTIAPWVWLILLPSGLWPKKPLAQIGRETYLHAFALIPVLLVPLFTAQFPRFYFSMLPWLMIVLARGLDRAVSGMEKISARNKISIRPGAAAVSAVLAVFLLSAALQIFRATPDRAYWDEVAYRRQVARKLGRILPERCRFLAELENQSIWHLAGYNPSRQVILPRDPLPEIVAYAGRTQAKYLVFHSSDFRDDRYDQLLPLLDPDFSRPGLKLVTRGQSPNGKTYVIYEIESVRCGDRVQD